MIEWWSSLTLIMKVLWAITLSASLIFVIQSVLTFLGVDADVNTDLDVSGDLPDAPSGMGLLTFRNFTNFFLGFGWAAILLEGQVKSTTLLVIISLFVGVGLVVAVMMLFKWLSSMQQSGNIDVFAQASGCEGNVYLSIPGGRSGMGKVQVTINGSVREYDAVTDGDSLPTGTGIRVVEAISSSTLLVEKTESIII